MKRELVVGAIGIVLLSAGCQTETTSREGERSPASTPGAPSTQPALAERPPAETAAYHRANLSKGETDGSVVALVDVPGYGYNDVTALETTIAAALPPRVFEGTSLHSVVDASGTEVAFLMLMRFKEKVAPPDRAAGLIVHAFSLKDPTTETVSGRKVFLREDPTSSSPYAYLLYDDGVLTWADHEDKTVLRTWLESYLDALKERQAA